MAKRSATEAGLAVAVLKTEKKSKTGTTKKSKKDKKDKKAKDTVPVVVVEKLKKGKATTKKDKKASEVKATSDKKGSKSKVSKVKPSAKSKISRKRKAETSESDSSDSSSSSSGSSDSSSSDSSDSEDEKYVRKGKNGKNKKNVFKSISKASKGQDIVPKKSVTQIEPHAGSSSSDSDSSSSSDNDSDSEFESEAESISKEVSVVKATTKAAKKSTPAAAVSPSSSSSSSDSASDSDSSSDSDAQATTTADNEADMAIEGVCVGIDLYLVDKKTMIAYTHLYNEHGHWSPFRAGIYDPVSKKIAFDSDAKIAKVAKAVAPPKEFDDDVDDEVLDTTYPYETNAEDHGETSARAYEDIAPILSLLCKRLGKKRHELKIYDPYYCQGAVIKLLAEHGYTNVYNRREDFYQRMADREIPEHDVVVTRPPYSEDHIPRIIDFCLHGNADRPWLALLPTSVYTFSWYKPAMEEKGHDCHPMYLAPRKNYTFTAPKATRKERRRDVPSTCNTFWYIELDKHTQKIYDQWQLRGLGGDDRGGTAGVALARSTQLLPPSLKDDNDPSKKKKKTKTSEPTTN